MRADHSRDRIPCGYERKMHTNVSMCLVKYNGIISTQNGIIKFPQQKRRDNFMKERTPKRDNYFAEAKRRDNFATLFRQYNTNARSRGVANGNYPVPCTTGSLAFDRILRGQRGCVWCFYGGKGDALCSWLAGAPATEAKRVHCAHGRLECQPSSWKLVDLNYLTDCTVCEVIRSTNLTSWFRARNPQCPHRTLPTPFHPPALINPTAKKDAPIKESRAGQRQPAPVLAGSLWIIG